MIEIGNNHSVKKSVTHSYERFAQYDRYLRCFCNLFAFKINTNDFNFNSIFVVFSIWQRQGVSYLSQTIDSLLKNQVDRSVDSRILVYVGETDEEFLRDLSRSLQSSYRKHIEDGILQVSLQCLFPNKPNTCIDINRENSEEL